MGQILLGGDQGRLQAALGGILYQGGQEVIGFDLVADFRIHLVHLSAGQPVNDRGELRPDRAGAFHGGGERGALNGRRLISS